MEEQPAQSIVDTIVELKQREPFEPFSIVMASGDRYVIERGENLVKLESQLFYGYPRSDRFVFMRISQIGSVEHGATAANGRAHKPRRRRKS